MKKFLVATLLGFSLLLTGCVPDFLKKPQDTVDSPDSHTETPADPTLDTSYLEIERYEPESCERRYFAIEGITQALLLRLPTEWNLVKQRSGEYIIQRNQVTIGRLIKGETTDTDQWFSIRNKEGSGTPLSRSRFLERREADGVVSFRFRFVYKLSNGMNTEVVTLIADYAEVGPKLATTLAANAAVEASTTDAATLILADSPKQNILILGNSFINSSNIGNILKEMINKNGKTANVTAVSWGYANVGTFVNDSSTMNKIKGGQYDVVFICGFYESYQGTTNLTTLKNACQYSDTSLVIFPVHNETKTTIDNACKLNPDLACVHWKNELDGLIEGGVNRSDLCQNDSYGHSKPLAGYVGAHMIYRSLYGESPVAELQNSIDQSYVDSYLGTYAKTGILSLIGKTNVFYLN